MLQVDVCYSGWFLHQCCSFGGMEDLPLASFFFLYKKLFSWFLRYIRDSFPIVSLLYFSNYGLLLTQNFGYGCIIEEVYIALDASKNIDGLKLLCFEKEKKDKNYIELKSHCIPCIVKIKISCVLMILFFILDLGFLQGIKLG